MERRAFIKGSATAALALAAPAAVATTRVDRAEWDSALRRCQVARSRYDACVARLRRKYGRAVDAPPDEQNALDDLCDQSGERETELMNMPAPDLAALRWKLDLLREPNGDMAPWTARFVRQAFADIARLLPPAS